MKVLYAILCGWVGIMLWEVGGNAYVVAERKHDCQQQLRQCEDQVETLDSLLKDQTAYYLRFYGIKKGALPGDTVIMIIH